MALSTAGSVCSAQLCAAMLPLRWRCGSVSVTLLTINSWRLCLHTGTFSQHSGLADKDTSPRTTAFQALTLVGQRFVPLGTIQGALAINLCVSAGLKPLGLNQKRCYTEQSQLRPAQS